MPVTDTAARWATKLGARDAVRIALRPVPAGILASAARRPGPIGRALGQGLRGRPTPIVEGPGTGLRIDVGGSNPRYVTGQNERPVQTALGELLEPGAVFFDVGANVGFLTLIGARMVGPTGYVVAFEPELDNLRVLTGNIRRNDATNVVVSTRAASSSTGLGELQLAGFSGGHSLATAADGGDGRAQLVETVTIDEVAASSGFGPPDVVKIDVEGAEAQVLEGMREVLSTRGPTLLIEVDGPNRSEHDRRHRAIVELLSSVGYGLSQIPESYGDTDWVVTHWVGRPDPAG